MNVYKSGFIWSFIDSFGLKTVQFLLVFYIAKLVGPDEFGLYAVLMLYLSVAMNFVDSGFGASVVRKNKLRDKDISTLFYTNIFVALFIYVIIAITAPILSRFLLEKRLVNLILVFGLVVLPMSHSLTAVAYLNRQLNLRKIVQIALPSVLIGGITGVVSAHLGLGVWSLVIMTLTTEALRAYFIRRIEIVKRGIKWSYHVFKYHWRFGNKLLLAGLLDSLFKSAYGLVIGKVFTVTDLGYFDRSRQLSDYGSSSITTVMGRVFYPYLSRISENSILESQFLFLLSIGSIVITPVVFISFILAPEIISILLGDAWNESIWMFRILSFSSVLYPVHSICLILIKAIGRSDIFLKLEAYKKGVALVILVLSLGYSMEVLLWGIVAGSVIGLLINLLAVIRLLNLSLLVTFKAAITPVVGGIFTLFLVSTKLVDFEVHSQVGASLINALLFCIIYSLIIFIFMQNEVRLSLNWFMKEKSARYD